MSKLLKATAILLGLLVAVILLALLIVDFGRFETRIERVVSEATGREFRIDGGLEIRALPSIRVTTSDVSLANAEWGSEPQMATIGHLSARVGVWSLLFGPPVIDELRLQDVDILLETDDDGTGNWVMGQPASAEPPTEEEAEGGAFEMPLYIHFAEIDDVKLRYLPTMESGFSVGTLGITTDESGQHVFDGAGQWQEWPFSLAGIVADRRVELDATLGELALTSTLDYARDTVDVTALLSTLDKLGEILEVEGLPPAELSLSGTVGMEGDSIELSDVLATLGSSRVTLDGEVDTGGTSRLTIEAEGPSLSELKPELPAVPFTLSTDLVAEEQTITLDPLTLNVAESDLRGSAQFTGGDAPGIKLRAQSSLIDLTPFQSTEPADGEGAAKQGTTGAAGNGAAKGTKSRYVFTEEPLPLDQLRNLQADVDVSVDKVKTSTFNMLEL